jgi:hypothetical protein
VAEKMPVNMYFLPAIGVPLMMPELLQCLELVLSRTEGALNTWCWAAVKVAMFSTELLHLD